MLVLAGGLALLRLSFPEFCRAFGWRNPAQALAYCTPTAAELADKM